MYANVCHFSKSRHEKCSIKQVFSKISQYWQETPVFGSFLIKLPAFRSVTFLKKTPTQVFTIEYFENFKSTYFEEHLRMVDIAFLGI